MSFLKDTSAPFLLTILIAAVGWLFDRSIAEFQNTAFLNFETVSETAGPANTFTVDLRNASLSQTLRNVTVIVQCPPGSACLRERPSSTPENQFLEFRSLPPYRLPIIVEADTNPSFSQAVLTFFPAGSSVRLRYHVQTDPVVSFSFPSSGTERISVYSGFSLRAWLAGNYFKALLTLLAVLSFLVLTFLAVAIRSRKGGGANEERQSPYPVVVLFDRFPPAGGP